MNTQTVFLTLTLSLVLIFQVSHASNRLSSVDHDIKKGVVEINELMVEKDRDSALESINDVSVLLQGTSGEPEYSVHQNLERLEFYLNKSEWVMARRILKNLMNDMGLDYQPTYRE